jgi:hypothetical protein
MVRKQTWLLLLVLVLCASIAQAKPIVDYDKSVDFFKYQTYAWGKGTPAGSDINQKRIVRAVNDQLQAVGLTEADGEPDIFVVTHVAVSREKQVSGSSWGYGGWYGYHGGWGSTNINVRDVPVGTLIIDLVDAESKELIFRGWDSATAKKSPQKMEKQVNKIVGKIFRRYPGAE